ncbi:hypothetical protein D3C77_712790 [compost metagenome]
MEIGFEVLQRLLHRVVPGFQPGIGNAAGQGRQQHPALDQELFTRCNRAYIEYEAANIPLAQPCLS